MGWKQQAQKLGQVCLRVADAFSLAILPRTLFSPFHQIAANDFGKSLQAKMSAWANRSFSRVFGFVVRLFTILVGVVCLLITATISLVWLAAWALIPLSWLVYLVLIMTKVVEFPVWTI